MTKSSKPEALSPQLLRNEFSQWLETPVGQSLLDAQREQIRHCISRYFGYHQLELLVSADKPVAQESLLGHRIRCTSSVDGDQEDEVLVAESHELPLVSDSIDLVVMHHTLDLSAHPHQVLRESCRVLRSGGHIVVVGFNPFSSWGLRKLLFRSRHAPWGGRFMSAVRLQDWLNLLDLQLHQISYSFFAPPVTSLKWMQRFGFLDRIGVKLKLPLGAFYIIQAQKRVGGAIPLKPRWQRRQVTGAAVVHQFSPYRKNEDS